MFAFPSQAKAEYYSYASEQIFLTEFPNHNEEVDGSFYLQGISENEEIYICIRGPEGEVEVQQASKEERDFHKEVNLRFGPGRHTIWVGPHPKKFSGDVKFYVNNSKEKCYLSETMHSDRTKELKFLSSLITYGKETEEEKARAICKWVSDYISYDLQAIEEQNIAFKPASVVLADQKGICSGISFLYASLCREAGLPTKIVYGTLSGSTVPHAWNEVLIGGSWVVVDATGAICGGRYEKYFGIEREYEKEIWY